MGTQESERRFGLAMSPFGWTRGCVVVQYLARGHFRTHEPQQKGLYSITSFTGQQVASNQWFAECPS
jgi:hypothetical protein